jgi:hypothetical protein
MSRQIAATVATARDRRKKYRSKVRKKISEKYFSFFLALNQYFPHIPYVASKK